MSTKLRRADKRDAIIAKAQAILTEQPNIKRSALVPLVQRSTGSSFGYVRHVISSIEESPTTEKASLFDRFVETFLSPFKFWGAKA